MAFPPDESKLVSIFIQTILYGAYVVLFCITTRLFLSGRAHGQSIRKNMFAVSILMFAIATTQLSVNFTRIIKAFIIFRDEPGGPAAFFNKLSEFTQMFGSTLYVAQTLLGDGIVLARCYIVWERRISVIAFPALLLLGSTGALWSILIQVTGVGILYSFDRVEPQAQIFVVQLSQWIVSFFSMTLGTNLICTFLVAYRIWHINTKGLAFSHRRLYPILVLIVESGAVYSAALLTLLILYKADSWFQYVVLDAITPTVGLVFSVIMFRILAGVTSVSGETRLLGEDDILMNRMDNETVDSGRKSQASHV